MADALRALLVCYSFPPVGGAGIQRSVKLAKYLPQFGVEPAVLTVSNPSVPLSDSTFDRDLPPGMEIVRARTLEPGYGVKQAAWSLKNNSSKATVKQRMVGRGVHYAKQLMLPDPQVLWLPGAHCALAWRLAQGCDDLLFITAPPFSQFLLAPLARLRPRTAIVFDYRDEWSTLRTTYEMLDARLPAAVGAAMEAGLLRLAHVVTTATEEFRDNLLQRFPFLDPESVVAIPNGYDPDDFPAEPADPPRDKLVISYAGTVFKLTSAQGFLQAVRQLHEREPELAKLLRVRFMGRIVDTQLESFEGTEHIGVERLGYVPHEAVLKHLASSHVVLCLLDDVAGVERIYPAKIFELMHLGRPVLTLSPSGALTRLVLRHRLGTVLPPRDVPAITSWLVDRLRAFRDGRPDPVLSRSIDAEGIARYHRRELAGGFAQVFRDAVERARGGVSRTDDGTREQTRA
ncbi:MAG: glycosyltransferase [Polyangiaceae bacterium]|jgi:glycosyltransferase involved in cell wall biosynthesis|nr:glycosyltransferase [Polyangiaceae bacterium]